MTQAGAVIGFECVCMALTGVTIVPKVYNVTPTGNTALTVFTELEGMRTDEHFPAEPHHDLRPKQCGAWLARATENIVIAPQCRQIVRGRLDSEKGQEPLH